MNFYSVFTAAITGLCVPCLAGTKKPPEKRPNVIIILTDDMGYGDISCYNQKQVRTPNIDRLAEEGVRFSDFYVPTPYSAPSRATLLTGRFPLRNGMIQNPAPDAGINDIGINECEVTLGELLQAEGYRTKCIGKWHLGHKKEYFPVKHGFDEYYGILYSNDMRPVQIIENMDTAEYPVDQRMLTQKYTAKALEFIQRNQSGPFFLYLAHAMPHKPLAASGKFYTGGTARDLYESTIRELDWSTGEVVGKLKELGILENTIVIFMSDNGPWYGGDTGGLKGMKANNWEGGIRVPFIIRYPQLFPRGRNRAVPCWSADVFPTIARLTGAKPDPSIILDGQDITDIIRGKSTSHKPILSMKNSKVMTIRDGKWKLFVSAPEYYREPDLTNWSDPRGPDGTTIIAPEEQFTPADYPGLKPEKMEGESLLFNVKKDPGERVNLSSRYPKVKKELLRKYRVFMNSLPVKKVSELPGILKFDISPGSSVYVNKTAGSIAQSPTFDLEIQQITSGSKHHFFGYIGQCQTIPWNASGRYILGLEIDTLDRMPFPGEAATIILIDTHENNKILRVDKTNAWNPQQGTMFYWNPLAAETQFFFNDRDMKTGEIFTVIYDVEKKKRVREYRYHDTPVGNAGVAANGSAWLGLNYGRLARLRPVTGYPGAPDWSEDEFAPENDGIYIVDLKTGKKRLLVSYRMLDNKLKENDPDLVHDGLFINHTLWNRDCDRIYFFVRAGWNGQDFERINTPFSIRPDGTGLTMHDINIGGHPEWAEGSLLIGKQGKNQILYDADRKKIIGQIGDPDIFPDPEGDISVSPDGSWLVNGHRKGTENFYTFFRRSDGEYARSKGVDRGVYSGNIRIDPAPQWNRTNDAILVSGIDKNQTRQLFKIQIIPKGE